MNKLLAFITLGITLLLASFVAMAQGMNVPEVDVIKHLGELVLNWNNMPDLLKGSAFVLILTQVVKKMSDFEYKRLLVTLLSFVYGVGQLVIGGQELSGALVSMLVAGGGAVALYEALKPLLKKLGLDVGSK
jgi:hypothetical protein